MLDEQAKSLKDMVSPDLATVVAAIRETLNDWTEAVNSCSADAIAALYTPDAVLLGTFDPKVSTRPEQRLTYFTNFKARKKLQATINECHIEVLDDNAAMANGLYTFRFVDDNGTPKTVFARFTFVYARQPEGDWLIKAHHSSVVPG